MIVDLIVLILLVLFVLHGIYRGFLVQLFALIALVAALLLAPLLGRVFQPLLARVASMAPTFRMIIGVFLAGLIIYALIRIGLSIGFHQLGRDEETHKLQPWNKATGGILGGVKGFLMLWVFFCLVFAFPVSGEQMRGGSALRRSRFGQAVTKWNPIARVRVALVVTGLAQVMDDPAMAKELREDRSVYDFLSYLQKETDSTRSLVDLRQVDLWKIVHDEELYRRLACIDLPTALKRARLAVEEKEARRDRGSGTP